MNALNLIVHQALDRHPRIPFTAIAGLCAITAYVIGMFSGSPQEEHTTLAKDQAHLSLSSSYVLTGIAIAGAAGYTAKNAMITSSTEE